MAFKEVYNASEAFDYVCDRRRARFIPRKGLRCFVSEWLKYRSNNCVEVNCTRYALHATKQNLKNPMLWFLISSILQYVVVPLLKKWWDKHGIVGI